MTIHPQISESVPALPVKRRLDYIDALRGMACLWVLMSHTFSHMPTPPGLWHFPAELLVRVSRIGWLGVSLFLVLSGFCLFYPLAVKDDLGAVRFDVKTFAVRRARRILPPYYAALFLLASLEIVNGKLLHGVWNWHIAFENRTDILLHLLMLHNLSSHSISSVSPAFWSLALESQLYVIFPVLVWFARRFGLKGLLVVTFFIAAAWQGYCFYTFGLSAGWSPSLEAWYHALPGRCFEFAAGMAAAAFVARPRPRQDKIALWLLALPLLPALYFVFYISRFGPLCDQAWGILFASLLVLLARLPNARFEQAPALRFFVWFGAISYSVYLVHQPLISLISVAALHLPNTVTVTYTAGIIRIPLLIGLGYFFHLAFERPFMSRPGKPAPKTERETEIAAVESPAP